MNYGDKKRAEKKVCGICRYFDSDMKQCRYNAPQIYLLANNLPRVLFPDTSPNSWCGKWERKEI